MNYIVEWVKSIFIMVVAVSFVKFLLPGGSMGKYLNFILSLMVLAVIVYPLGSIGEEGIRVSDAVPYNSTGDAGGTDEWALGEEEIDYVQTKQIEQVYKEKVEALIKETVETEFSGIRVLGSEIYINEGNNTKQITGAIQFVTVYINDADYEKKVRDLVAETLSLKQDKVTVKYMEG